MSTQIKRLLSVAFVAALLLAAPHAPARAASAPSDQSCGQVDLATSSGDDAAKSFGCFATAFSTCNATSLVTTGRDGDALVTRTFLTVSGDDHGCSIAETVARTKSGTTTTDAYSCSGVRREKDGLIMTGCGAEGQVALRAAAKS